MKKKPKFLNEKRSKERESKERNIKQPSQGIKCHFPFTPTKQGGLDFAVKSPYLPTGVRSIVPTTFFFEWFL